MVLFSVKTANYIETSYSRSKLTNTSEEWSAKAQTAYNLAAAFASDFIAFTLLNTAEMKLFGVSSLLGCVFSE